MQEVMAGTIEYSYGPFPEPYQAETEVGEVTTESYVDESATTEPSEPGA
jgi:hypothetical protein